MKNKKISIFGKVFAKILLFAALIVAMLWCLQTLLLDNIYKEIKTSRANTALSAVVKNINTEDDNLYDTMYDIGTYYNVCIMVFNERFELVASVESEPRCVIHALRPSQLVSLYTAAVENGGTLTDKWDLVETTSTPAELYGGKPSASFVTESIVKVAVVSDDSGQERIVFVNSLISPLTETAETLKVLLLWISGAIFFLALLVAFFISRSISKPICKINKEAALLANGDFDATFSGSDSREISELSDTLRYAATELSKAESLRRELIANISHDLRTPLTAIGGTAELMRDFPDERTGQNFDTIISEIGKLTKLVGDVMDLSKIQSRFSDMSVTSLDLTALIDDVVSSFAADARTCGYTISFDHGFDSENNIFVLCNEAGISRVVQNLLSNAVNYLGDGSSIAVTQSLTETGDVKIEVRDDGEGISEEDLPHIFERYYRSNKPHKRSSDGSGLGLSIVKSILDAHGSAYGVSSSKGAGSSFWFTLKIDKNV